MTPDFERQQGELLSLLGVEGRPVDESNYVHVSDSAERAASVVGVHIADQPPFSGWQILATTEAPALAKFGYCTVAELRDAHPAWLLALPLPAGWAFRCVGDTLIDCVFEGGERKVVNMSVSRP